jgi:chloramphenicol 3-O-phosphotransferase
MASRQPSASPVGSIILITGIMAAGKSTIAQALAERLPRSVHLRGDLYRRMIVNGQEPVTPENWDAAERQLHLRQRIATDVARTYAANGYTVCYQDVVLGADLPRVISFLEPSRYPVYAVILAPSADAVAQRDRHRGKTGYTDWTPAELDRSLRDETPHIGLWLDTSALTAEATVDTILARLDDARL